MVGSKTMCFTAFWNRSGFGRHTIWADNLRPPQLSKCLNTVFCSTLALEATKSCKCQFDFLIKAQTCCKTHRSFSQMWNTSCPSHVFSAPSFDIVWTFTSSHRPVCCFGEVCNQAAIVISPWAICSCLGQATTGIIWICHHLPPVTVLLVVAVAERG